jgi:hypothetical protein
MDRPRVNLQGVDAVLQRLLAHPMASVAEELLPQTWGALRAAAADLPAMASGLEARALEHGAAAARELEAELVGSLTRWVQETIRKGRGMPKPKMLRAPRRIAARKSKGKRR